MPRVHVSVQPVLCSLLLDSTRALFAACADAANPLAFEQYMYSVCLDSSLSLLLTGLLL
jgi:hypothetical protein